MVQSVLRPLLRYHGGKFRLAKWIISHFPPHRVYLEPYGGAASVLLQKPRAYAEVYNDLDGELVNVFTICRTRGPELVEALRYTPFSRTEFETSYQPVNEPLERARRMFIRSHMGFAGIGTTGHSTGFRSDCTRSGTTPAHDWMNFAGALPAIIARLRGVVLENREALDLMQEHDSESTLHYVDPPYVRSTRYKGEKTACYRFEMTDEQHVTLCRHLLNLDGMVVLSGYDNEIYESLGECSLPLGGR